MKTILVTGGAGFIGTHTIVELHNAGYEFVVVDNFVNSNIEALKRVGKIIGRQVPFYELDIRDKAALGKVLSAHKIDACIHFAALKAVGESIEKPLEYYANNITGTLALVEQLRNYGCKNLVFSSSATVYGDPDKVPITEDCIKKECTNPYGKTKSMLEECLSDIQRADQEWNIVLLRYFNPIGAHTSGLIGENPKGIPNNLMPYITQVAAGERLVLNVFGNGYDTPDGTGVRDYIHVMDLARGHIAALSAIEQGCGLKIYNLGTGKGYSVLEVVKTFEKVNNVNVPYRIVAPRAGDVAACYCNPQKAKEELGWSAQYGLDQMCADSWNWQKNNIIDKGND